MGNKRFFPAFLVFFVVSFFATPSFANVKQIKAYKEAFPDEKPKCIGCHTSEKPKKDDGQHDVNEYGQKVKDELAAEAEPSAEIFKKLGKIPA